MNDYNKMLKYLEGLSQNEFERLISEFCGIELSEVDDNLWIEVLVETGGHREVSPRNWRKDWTETLLSYKEDKKAEWHRLCHYARIEVDSAKQLKMARRSQWVSFFAFVISVGSFVLSILSFIKH